ncbi:MAG: hypothetical protein HYR89_09615 [Actinobacteria bacterium]|nr:hypothetical protein [Actinomycetota bacterium]
MSARVGGLTAGQWEGVQLAAAYAAAFFEQRQDDALQLIGAASAEQLGEGALLLALLMMSGQAAKTTGSPADVARGWASLAANAANEPNWNEPG